MQENQRKQEFYNVIKNRRSIRVVGNEGIISQKTLEDIIGNAVKYSPTAFNAQEQQVILLLGSRHKWFWSLVKEKLRAIVPEEKFSDTDKKINGFADGVGTILTYQDTDTTKKLQEQFPNYKDNFPIWAHQSTGMLKYTIWTSLVSEGYGVSLQHYTELIEKDVQEELNINPSWKMNGQIPFGTPMENPEEKEFMPLEKRMLIFR